MTHWQSHYKMITICNRYTISDYAVAALRNLVGIRTPIYDVLPKNLVLDESLWDYDLVVGSKDDPQITSEGIEAAKSFNVIIDALPEIRNDPGFVKSGIPLRWLISQINGYRINPCSTSMPLERTVITDRMGIQFGILGDISNDTTYNREQLDKYLLDPLGKHKQAFVFSMLQDTDHMFHSISIGQSDVNVKTGTSSFNVYGYPNTVDKKMEHFITGHGSSLTEAVVNMRLNLCMKMMGSEHA